MTVSLRSESPADEDFLRRLIIETVAEELGADSWPEPMRTHLLTVQYTARRQSRRTHSPESTSSIIQADGADAGWIVLSTSPRDIYIADIIVLRNLRGQGIGAAAIREVLAAASEAGKAVRLNVNVMNHAAIRLYERLGFQTIEQDAVQYLMQYGSS